jgi:hypothetical protein
MSAAPIIFNASSVSASGTLVTVASADARGQGPARLTIKNTGSHALTACKVQLGPDSDHVVDYDTSTFASLAAGAILQIPIDRPVNAIVILATCTAGTTLDAALAVHQR